MSAIDFSKITKTVDGLDCYYIGKRTSGDQVLHRFAVFNNASELFSYYNEQGERVEFFGNDGWAVCKGGLQIIAPPKIVELSHCIGLYKNSHGDFFISTGPNEESLSAKNLLAWQQHTFRFEVPNE